MEETNSTKVNSCEQPVNAGTPAGQPVPANSYSVNSKAESVLNVVAVIVLIGGIIAGLGVFISCMQIASSPYAEFIDGEVYILYGILGAPLIFCVCGLLPWAGIKVYINMSRNLFAIREEVHQLKDRV